MKTTLDLFVFRDFPVADLFWTDMQYNKHHLSYSRQGLALLLAMTNDLMMYDLGLTFPPHFPAAHCLYYQGQQSANQT